MPIPRRLSTAPTRRPADPTRRTARRLAPRAALCAALCAALAGPALATSETGTGAAPDALARSTARFADRVVIPAHERLTEAAGGLVEAASAFDADPDGTGLDAFREAWLSSVTARDYGRAFAFGPVHSLGHDVALGFPTDVAGVERLIESLGETSVADIEARRLTPSLTGLDTIGHLLFARDEPEGFTPATRRYLHALARRVERVATELLDVWRDGHDGRPPFATALATAGAADNHAYLSVEGAAEEIVRGLIDCLDVVVHEDLPAALAGESDRASLARLRATLAGVAAAYREGGVGAWLPPEERAVDTALRRSLDEASAALASDAGPPALERTTDELQRVLTSLEEHVLPTTLPGRASTP